MNKSRLLFWLSVLVGILSVLCCCKKSDESKPLVPAPAPAPAGFVDVTDIIPDIITDIRYATKNNFTGEVLDGYGAARAFLLPETAAALKAVQTDLKAQGLGLKLYDGYRPMQAEKHMIRWAQASGNEHLLYEGYLAGTVDPLRTFSHSCGNAVDVTIVDENGNELDMGTTFDTFSEASWTANASGAVLENRLLLRTVMGNHGFVNFDREWWHYNYFNAPGRARDDEIR